MGGWGVQTLPKCFGALHFLKGDFYLVILTDIIMLASLKGVLDLGKMSNNWDKGVAPAICPCMFSAGEYLISAGAALYLLVASSLKQEQLQNKWGNKYADCRGMVLEPHVPPAGPIPSHGHAYK